MEEVSEFVPIGSKISDFVVSPDVEVLVESGRLSDPCQLVACQKPPAPGHQQSLVSQQTFSHIALSHCIYFEFRFHPQ